MAEKFFWADAIAEEVIKNCPDKKTYVCASGITPSGTVHIGNFREVITTDLVVRALKERGKKVKFVYSWDDYDRFRKIPKNVSKDYEKYLGMPISDVPSPFGKGSYAEHFEKEFEKSLEKVWIKPEFVRQNVMNKNCKYAELIKKAIEERVEIKDILDKYRRENLKDDWYPVIVYCSKCKKDSTRILEAGGYEIKYECHCGHIEKFDFRKKGIVKLVWRVDWPMRWKYEGVDFEPGGIDHSAPGGSYTTAKEISQDVYDYKPPTYVFYDWVRVKGGKEFSSSAGNVLTLDEVEEIYEPEILRYLFVGTRPNKGFQISFDKDVIKIYEDYDALENKYYDGEANPQEKKIYEFSRLKVSKKKPDKLSFRHLVTLVQIGKIKDLSERNKIRAEKVRNWIEKYADSDMKFEVQKDVKIKLSAVEKKAMAELKEVLKKKYNDEEIFESFNSVCEKTGISKQEFFKVAYQIIIGNERGPRLVDLINNVGKEKVIKLIEQIK